jgi:hypothetical protein
VEIRFKLAFYDHHLGRGEVLSISTLDKHLQT